MNNLMRDVPNNAWCEATARGGAHAGPWPGTIGAVQLDGAPPVETRGWYAPDSSPRARDAGKYESARAPSRS
jgi:hypothetical protein